ncbi:hypothetical protein Dfri01_10240 [Dyadobacter frigoris]|nr:hypothetical protein Dfri01_10240 [Dyadobacter frigoris]
MNEFKVFVASPSDVSDERVIISKVIADINFILSAIVQERKIVLDLIQWDTHTVPGLGIDAQKVINEQIPKYDIFIGVMWKRFGTPTTTSGSGTEEEFLIAYNTCKTNSKFPVLFYFSQKHISYPTSEEIKQLRKVLKFKEELSRKGLVWDYMGPDEFVEILRRHLVMTVSKLINNAKDIIRNVSAPENALTKNDLELVQQRVFELREEFTTIHNSKDTQSVERAKLSALESKMRSMALDVVSMLQQLVTSDSIFDRLLAISAMKEIPQSQYFEWLANRVGSSSRYGPRDTSFISLNASIALLIASHTFKGDLILAPINIALENFNNSTYKDPNILLALSEAKRKAFE